jgi:uncharacterized protein
MLSKKTNMEPRISIITLGVNDLENAFNFYKNTFGFPTDGLAGEGELKVAFFKLKGTWLALYPRENLAKDGNISNNGIGFPGFSLAHIVKTRMEVDQFVKTAVSAGATITDAPRERDWGGYSGYIKDLDGFLWEIAYMNNPLPIE